VIAKLKCEMIQVFRTLAPHNCSETILFQRSSTNFFFLFNDRCAPWVGGDQIDQKVGDIKNYKSKTNVYNTLMKLGEFQKIPGWCNIQSMLFHKNKWPLYKRSLLNWKKELN